MERYDKYMKLALQEAQLAMKMIPIGCDCLS